MKKKLAIYRNDPWLEPYAPAIEGRHQDAVNKEKDLTQASKSLSDFANAHKYFGLHRDGRKGWVFREWLPNASGVTLVGDFSGWEEKPEYALTNIGNGVWEVKLPKSAMKHGDHFKMRVSWPGGMGDRMPAYINRVIRTPKPRFSPPRCGTPSPTSGKWKTLCPTPVLF